MSLSSQIVITRRERRKYVADVWNGEFYTFEAIPGTNKYQGTPSPEDACDICWGPPGERVVWEQIRELERELEADPNGQ